MRSKSLASAAALSALVLASPALASVTGFRLPSDQPQPAPPPDLQGPVAPDVPASRQRSPSPAPAATVDQPAVATPAAPPVEVPAGLQPAPAATAPRTATPAPRVPASAADAASAGQPAAALPDATAPVSAPPTSGPLVTAPAAAPAREGSWTWLWLLVALPAIVAALAAVGWAIRRQVRRPLGPVAAPRIERPRVGPAPPAPAPAAPAGEPLQVSLEPLRLALTLVNATLAWRLELANRGTAPLTGLTIGADMIAAHASMSREEHLSGPRRGNGGGAAPVQRIERLGPGESRVIEGEFRLPFPQIVPIRQGDAALLLPLARFRVDAEGAAPTVRTFAIGQPGQANGLQPFRLDQGPRIYPRLTQHAFA